MIYRQLWTFSECGKKPLKEGVSHDHSCILDNSRNGLEDGLRLRDPGGKIV